MRRTCKHVWRMGMIQIRNVPDDVHRTMKARAAKAGMSLSDFLLRRIEEEARLPSIEEWFEGVEKLPRVHLSESAADVIRQGREERDAHIDRVLEEGRQRDKGTKQRNVR